MYESIFMDKITFKVGKPPHRFNDADVENLNVYRFVLVNGKRLSGCFIIEATTAIRSRYYISLKDCLVYDEGCLKLRVWKSLGQCKRDLVEMINKNASAYFP